MGSGLLYLKLTFLILGEQGKRNKRPGTLFQLHEAQ